MHLSLKLNSRQLPIFYQLLGHGFSLNIRTGCSVKDLLCEQLGIHENYLARRIQTIFLNGKVVDDQNSAIVEENATLALSGAMPGLVGAILRSGGFYAAMRRQISHEKTNPAQREQTGNITLKLLNLVVKDLGPTFLQRGVWIKGDTLQEFIKRYAEELRAGSISGELDGKPAGIDTLLKTDLDNDPVLLKISSDPEA